MPVSWLTNTGRIGVLPPLRLFRFAGHGAHGPAVCILAPHQQGNVCVLNLASFSWERGGVKCIFKGETCQKSGGFHQLERGLRGGRGGARNSDFADLALCSCAACSFSSEDRTTSFGCLLLMKTTRFLAGLPDICAHPEIGEARGESPDPCLMARALLRRSLATNPHLA